MGSGEGSLNIVPMGKGFLDFLEIFSGEAEWGWLPIYTGDQIIPQKKGLDHNEQILEVQGIR